jgi:integrase
MGQTRTSGIATDANGNKIVNKQVYGKTIYARLGAVSQDEAEAWLAGRIERIKLEREGGTRPRVTFREAAARYLKDCIGKVDTADIIAFHIELLDPWIGDLGVDEVYDETLEPFKLDRLKPTVTTTGKPKQVSLTTLNRSLEVVRRILNLCARSYRHPNRMTYLETAPLITIERNKRARKQYPLSWDEQDLLFSELPADPNRQMATFKVNTGCREQEVCRLEWAWEVQVPELKTSVFIVPGNNVKNEEDRLVVLNREARAIVDARRGIHERYVFTYRGRPGKKKPLHERGPGAPLDCMNNGAWQSARVRAAIRYEEKFGRSAPWGLAHVRVHDLKHTFGRRLRAAGVSDETRKVLLGHKNGDITTHYSAAELAELITAVNKIDRSLETPAITLLRVAA